MPSRTRAAASWARAAVENAAASWLLSSLVALASSLAARLLLACMSVMAPTSASPVSPLIKRRDTSVAVAW